MVAKKQTNRQPGERADRKIFFKVYHNQYFDDFGEFTHEEIMFFQENMEIIKKAVDIIIEATNTRITYINIPILKAIFYNRKNKEDLC